VNQSTIGRRYASALFQLLEESGIEPARNALGSLAQGLEDTPALKHVLASPVFKYEEKQVVLEELCQRLQAPPVMRDFLNQLLKNNRAVLLPEISQAFSDLADEQKGIQQLRVSSAKPLDAAERQQVKHELSETLGRSVDVVFEVEPKLIAGLKIYIGSQVFDNTVLGRLTSMQDQLTKG
jgi:F-type H+-transporting ATPase subunit delta